MAAKLVAEEGILKGLVLSLEDGDQWVIGRDPDACQLLVEDPSASRKHLICRTTPKGILVENLSETNPVQINEVEVKEPRLLHNGDAVKIGDGIFRYYAEAAAKLYNVDDDEKDPSRIIEKVPENEQNAADIEPQEKEDAEINPAAQPENQQNIVADNANLPKQPDNDQDNKEPHMDLDTQKEDNKDKISPPRNEDFLHETSIMDDTNDDGEKRHDSIFDDDPGDKHGIAEINFGLLDTGRWLLKVISGPNNGAEFSMQSGNSYIIGTDPNACDIVFHDTSVSRQHTRIAVNQDDTMVIEDLKSRNGTLVDGESLQGKRTLAANSHVSVGTTSFVVFDREGEMQTIISPLMPAIVKVLQTEEHKAEASTPAALAAQAEQAAPIPERQHNTNLGAFILIGILTGLFVLVGIGTTTLFKSEPVAVTESVDPSKALSSALGPFTTVKYSFNPSSGQLLLVGHVLTHADKSQLLYSLQGLTFIKSLDDSGVIIDEYVWREINQVLEKNPGWKGINVMSTTPGHFVVSGYLQTRAQADRLSEYLSANFPYPDLLENRTVVEQDIQASINTLLQSTGLKTVTAKLDNGEVTLTGGVPPEKIGDIAAIVTEIKDIRGVRSVRNATSGQAIDQSIVNISDKYDVTGLSNQGGKLSVVINGRILMKGDVLDGMAITLIQQNVIFLEKDATKYRIDINH